MASVPGRSFLLQAGRDYDDGKEYAPERSARAWAARRGLPVEVRKRPGAVLVTFNPVRKGQSKFAKSIAEGREWTPCKAHERERASKVARLHRMRAEFTPTKVRFVPRSPSGEAGSTP